MKNIITIFKRELNAYFNSAIAYIFIIVFLLISAGLFMIQFFLVSTADMRGFFFSLPLILCIFLPAVTMRLWAEDRRGNTLELLLTFPVNTHELVLGKFLASLVFYAAALFSTLPIPIMIMALGNPDSGALVCQYLGSLFLGSFFLALGIFISGFCKDQIVSFILAMMGCFGFFLLGTDFTVGSIDGWIPGLGSFLKSSLGVTQHFFTFQKGVIDIRDVLYFVIGTAIFLILNGFWLETRMRPKARSVFMTTSLISIGIFTIFNFILSDTSIGRFDLTEGKIYTISKATSQILRELKAPVTAKLFISSADKMPSGMKTLERDIRDKLDELKVAAKGKFNYKVFHMEVTNIAKDDGEENLEKAIEKKGIKPFRIQSVEADEVGVKLIYSSMSLAYKEKPEEIIPTITSNVLMGLEYTIVSKIYKMTLDAPPSVALVAPYSERLVDPQMRQVLQYLGQLETSKYRDDNYELIPRLLQYEGYQVSRIRLTENEPIPAGTDTLIVIEPGKLSDRQRFEINRFLVNGGSVFLAVQRYEFGYKPVGVGGMTVTPTDKDPRVNALLEKWGLSVNKDFLMDTEIDVISVSGGSFMGVFSVSSPVKLPIQLKIIHGQMNKKVSITSRLSTLLYLWGSALTLDQEKLKALKLEKEILFSTSPGAWEAAYHDGDLTQPDLVMPPRSGRKEFPLAILVKGNFPDAFSGEVPEWQGPGATPDGMPSPKKVPEEKIELTPKPGKLILLGCAKMFSKEVFNASGHISLFLNSIDAITLDEKLVRVRSKRPIDRSVKRISSAAKATWKIFTMFFVPIVLAGLGGFRLFARKRAKWLYLKRI